MTTDLPMVGAKSAITLRILLLKILPLRRLARRVDVLKVVTATITLKSAYIHVHRDREREWISRDLI